MAIAWICIAIGKGYNDCIGGGEADLATPSVDQINNLVDLLDGYFTERGRNGFTIAGQHL